MKCVYYKRESKVTKEHSSAILDLFPEYYIILIVQGKKNIKMIL